MRTGYFYLPAVLLVAGWPLSTASAQVTRTAIAAQQQARQVKIAFLIASEQTRREVARSDAVIQALYKRLDTATAKTRVSLRRANLSDQERVRLQGELGRLRDEQDALISQLAAKDAEYAASIRAYREGLSGLLADNDPRILALLERVADGDARAADELQDLTRIIRKAREAGVNARNAADQRGVATVWGNEKDRGNKTTAQALAAWQEAAALDPDDFWQWIYIARLQQEAGNLTGAAQAAERTMQQAHDKRERGVALVEVGDVAVAQGRLGDARSAFAEYLKLSRELLSANPSGTVAKRDVSVSLSRVGDVAVAQGRLGDARSAFEESLKLSRELLLANPSSAVAKRDVGVSLNFVGNVAVAQGRLGDARSAYEEDLKLSRELLSANPSSANAKRDVSVSLNRVGDVAVAQGRLGDARIAFEEYLTLSRELQSANPSSAVVRRDVSFGLERLGKLAVTQGRLDDARRVYEEALAIDEASLAANPTSVEAKRDVMVSHVKLAQLLQGESHYRDALAIAEDMARDGVLAPSDEKYLEALRAVVKALDTPK